MSWSIQIEGSKEAVLTKLKEHTASFGDSYEAHKHEKAIYEKAKELAIFTVEHMAGEANAPGYRRIVFVTMNGSCSAYTKEGLGTQSVNAGNYNDQRMIGFRDVLA